MNSSPIQRIDLARLSWTLCGWPADDWRGHKPLQLAGKWPAETGPIPARWPGSVQMALLRAGLIPDWNVGRNSLACEWIEHHHWDFTARLPRGLGDGRPVRLHCEGLDYEGAVLIDGVQVARFQGALRPHTIDLTPHIKPGSRWLSFMFEGAPAEQNQFGFTSRSRFFKPRFAYGWDWCPRIVPLGPWDRAWLEVGDAPRLTNLTPRPRLREDLRTGELSVICHAWSPRRASINLVARLSRNGRVAATRQFAVTLPSGDSERILRFDPLKVTPWQPNGSGEQALYHLEIEMLDADGASLDTAARRIGFKQIRWLPCEDAPKGALPWLCEVNGRPVFLQGVNWTPIRPNYQDLTVADYRKRLTAYRRMGCNLLRVWGGGLIEKPEFYDLCDELGLMVWQEFPLSSSGSEAFPPTEPRAVEDLLAIAESALRRRAGHASLIQWCGGNELVQPVEKQDWDTARPANTSQPTMAALSRLVRRMDPDTRFLPTSPQGPRFFAQSHEIGLGLHHNVHGPWNLEGAPACGLLPGTLEAWKDYFDRDDALFRAELGHPGASPLDLILKYCGELSPVPPDVTNLYWRHGAHWWVDGERFRDQLPAGDPQTVLRAYIAASQNLQTRALTHAVRAVKRRFPRAGGVLIWMGHDAFPCPANTAIIDFEGRPKPAARALGRIFRGPAGK